MARCFGRLQVRRTGGFYKSPRIVARVIVSIGFILTASLSGCAHNAYIPSNSFEHIEIIALDNETSPEAAPSKGKSAAAGAAAGAMGGLMSSLLLSMACGPYFAICFAAAAPVTIGATTLVGGVIGMSGISEKDAVIITPYLEAIQADHNMNQELATALSEQLPASSLVPPGTADARISLDVNSVRLSKVFGRKITFSLTVVSQYEWSLNQPTPQQSSRTFTCERSLPRIDEWANDGGATIENELKYCIEDLALQIHKVLTAPPMPDDGFSEVQA